MVSFAFYLLAALMLLVALAGLLWPLLRQGRRESRSSRWLALAITLLLPLAAGGLYLKLGQPSTLHGVPKQNPQLVQLEQGLAKLRAHLEQNPADVQGWLLLGQTYAALHQPEIALDAYGRVLQTDQHNVLAMIGWAEMQAMLRPDHQFAGRSRDLLQAALDEQPDNQRALWLLGISDMQQQQYADAIARWKQLQAQLTPGSELERILSRQIEDAQQRLHANDAATPAIDQGKLPVAVSLAPALRSQLQPGDVLFVYARAVSGPPMPLAVLRGDPKTLPARFVLTDAMAMLPGHTLSRAGPVIVGARISHSGQAMPEPGDLQGESGSLRLPQQQVVNILIDKVR